MQANIAFVRAARRLNNLLRSRIEDVTKIESRSQFNRSHENPLRIYGFPFENNFLRNYATSQVASVEDIRKRVFKVVRSYDKISPRIVKDDTHFLQDLGLDSLDHVEIMMSLEDEFGFEIPEVDAEKLLRPYDIVKYIAKKEKIDEESIYVDA